MEPQDALRKYHLLHYFAQWYSPHSYGLNEVAAFLKVSPETILSYIAANELPAEPVGNSYRIAVEDLEDFLMAKANKITLRRERRCAGI